MSDSRIEALSDRITALGSRVAVLEMQIVRMRETYRPFLAVPTAAPRNPDSIPPAV